MGRPKSTPDPERERRVAWLAVSYGTAPIPPGPPPKDDFARRCWLKARVAALDAEALRDLFPALERLLDG